MLCVDRILSSLMLLSVLAGCEMTSPPPADAGPSLSDAGPATGTDAGPPTGTDAGPVTPDAGPSDAGPTPTDAGPALASVACSELPATLHASLRSPADEAYTPAVIRLCGAPGDGACALSEDVGVFGDCAGPAVYIGRSYIESGVVQVGGPGITITSSTGPMVRDEAATYIDQDTETTVTVSADGTSYELVFTLGPPDAMDPDTLDVTVTSWRVL